MEWAIGHDPNNLGLRLPESMWRFWELRGHFTEGRLWLERALAAAPQGPPGCGPWRLTVWATSPDCKAISGWPRSPRSEPGHLARARGPQERGRSALEPGQHRRMQGDFTRAEALQKEALAVAREIGEPLRIALALNNLALVLWNMGDRAGAAEFLEESVGLKRREGNRAGLATSLNNLGSLLADEGEYERAKVYLEETLTIDRELGNPCGIADSLGNLASLASIEGDITHAAALEAEALQLRRDIDDRLSIAYSLESIASTVSEPGSLQMARNSLGAAEQLREDLGAPLPPSEFSRYEMGLTLLAPRSRIADFDEDWRQAAGSRSTSRCGGPEGESRPGDLRSRLNVAVQWFVRSRDGHQRGAVPASDQVPSNRKSHVGTDRIAHSPRRERNAQRQ